MAKNLLLCRSDHVSWNFMLIIYELIFVFLNLLLYWVYFIFAQIADFGLSNVFDEKHRLDTFCGSPLYASPEIVKGIPYLGPEVCKRSFHLFPSLHCIDIPPKSYSCLFTMWQIFNPSAFRFGVIDERVLIGKASHRYWLLFWYW